jgi:hypothetical protein
VLILRYVALGLLVGGLAGLLLGAYRLLLAPQGTVPGWLIAAAIVPPPLLGLIFGAFRPQGWRLAAATVDDRYRLKDRAVTAVDFLRKPEPTALHSLQLADAAEHLSKVSATEAVPLRVSRALPAALISLALAAAMLTMPLSKRVEAGPTRPDENIVAVAEQVADDLKELDKVAEEQSDEEMKDLLKEMKELAEEMKEPGVDTREAMAKLSAMQQSILALQAEMNLGLVDGQMQSLGEALSAAEALEPAASALQEGKYEKAAKALEDPIDPGQLERKEAKTLKEKLERVAKAMNDAGLGQISEGVTEMMEGLDDPPNGKFGKGSKAVAKFASKQASRKKIKEILDIEIDKLEECKGQCDSDKAVRIRMPMKSESPSRNAGANISGNTEGEKTEKGLNRERQDITGTQGDGPSEIETVHNPEGRQQAQRGFREAYERARAKSEAVLESEPIPLGHRQTIRRYFELIRPQNGQAAEAP